MQKRHTDWVSLLIQQPLVDCTIVEIVRQEQKGKNSKVVHQDSAEHSSQKDLVDVECDRLDHILKQSGPVYNV